MQLGILYQHGRSNTFGFFTFWYLVINAQTSHLHRSVSNFFCGVLWEKVNILQLFWMYCSFKRRESSHWWISINLSWNKEVVNSHLRDEEPSSPNCPQHPPHTYSKEKSTAEYRFKHIIQSKLQPRPLWPVPAQEARWHQLQPFNQNSSTLACAV